MGSEKKARRSYQAQVRFFKLNLFRDSNNSSTITTLKCRIKILNRRNQHQIEETHVKIMIGKSFQIILDR
jgi:hypothetical protein